MRINPSHLYPRKNQRKPLNTRTKLGHSSTHHFHWQPLFRSNLLHTTTHVSPFGFPPSMRTAWCEVRESYTLGCTLFWHLPYTMHFLLFTSPQLFPHSHTPNSHSPSFKLNTTYTHTPYKNYPIFHTFFHLTKSCSQRTPLFSSPATHFKLFTCSCLPPLFALVHAHTYPWCEFRVPFCPILDFH